MLDIFRVDIDSRVPKYQQIVNSVISGISNGYLSIDEKIPSINEVSEEFYLSRDTVEKAYNILKEQKIITSVKGKGFYIAKTFLLDKKNILFLVNKPSSYKMRIFNSFVNKMGADAHVDLSIYHCDTQLFINTLNKFKRSYDYFVIMPHFKSHDLHHLSSNDDIVEAVEEIPKEKLIILDNNFLKISGNIREVYQDFENDIFDALVSGRDRLKKYKKIILVYPMKAIYPYPKRILRGFKKFCQQYDFDHEILDEIYPGMELRPMDAYITIEENDLVSLVKQIREAGFIMGKSIGVISYNDTPLKELLGITVVSTDFKKMGEKAARMLVENTFEKTKNPFNILYRSSL
ncbi:MAG: transcriptional regulator [Cytophagaceae bacterium]|nr:transcriptional regulator [Cytophagaceae bacterium]|tara:strand:+ start:10653 stop:11693 length:1041 start_codon:yes stop_codon:yes gene_type:complete